MITEQEIIAHPYVVSLAKSNEASIKKIEALQVGMATLKQQLAWYKNALFGTSSERRTIGSAPITGEQLPLFDLPPAATPPEADTETITYRRKKSNKQTQANNASESGLRFGPEVEVVEVPVDNPEISGLQESEYEVVSEKVTEKLCRRKGANYIKRYRQQVVKILKDGKLVQPPAPERVIDSSIVDVSFLAGMLVDKFVYHQPINRQHARLLSESITVSRGTLSSWTHAAIGLLEPIYKALQGSVLSSKILSMDETPHKAGRRHGDNKMSTCYYWFLYGDQDEVFIHNSETRGLSVVQQLLFGKFKGIILSDGYAVYEAITKQLDLILANCWAHARRKFVEAEEQEPTATARAIELIRTIYQKESLAPPEPEPRLEHRLAQVKPIVDTFFTWLEEEQHRIAGFPTTGYSKALFYALERKASLQVFLSHPAVPIDNNHTERQIRPIVMGRKNYLFCWTEVGAQKVAIIQSLILSCQLQDVDPWDYLNDVLVRVASHPVSRVDELLPRNWKRLFAKKATPVQPEADKAVTIA